MTRPLLVVQPSADYARKVRESCPEAVLLGTPERAAELAAYPRVIAADLDDFPGSYRTVRNWSDQSGIRPAGIVCFVCEYLPLTTYLARRLGLPFHSQEALRRTRRKELTAAAWEAADVPTPPTRLVRDLQELRDFTLRHPPPWILKPSSGTGSEWVLRADDPVQLTDAFQRITAGLAAQELGDPRSVSCLIQRCVFGREFGADIYLDDGGIRILRLTEKLLLDAPGQTGMVGAYFFPLLAVETRRLLEETFLRGARALGIERGIAMVDVILADETPYLLEMALRPGGDCLPELCRQATGYDPLETTCLVALGGRPNPIDIVPETPLAALHLMSDRSGILRRIDCARLLRHPRVVDLIEVYHLPGEQLRCWEGSYDDRILAACLVRYEDREELARLAVELPHLIDLELEEFSLSPTSPTAEQAIP